MKNKNQKIQALQQDLIKYSKQIGILDCEIPELVFSREEFSAKNKETEDRLGLHRRRLKGKRYLGACSISRRMLLIRMDGGKTDLGTVWKVTKRTKQYIWSKQVPYGLREIKNTLVHELVHYRFPEMKHGKKFEARIKETLRGEEFPRIHITSPRLREWR